MLYYELLDIGLGQHLINRDYLELNVNVSVLKFDIGDLSAPRRSVLVGKDA